MSSALLKKNATILAVLKKKKSKIPDELRTSTFFGESVSNNKDRNFAMSIGLSKLLSGSYILFIFIYLKLKYFMHIVQRGT